MKQPEDAATIADVFEIITPLFLALHHEGVISARSVAMQYEDVLARRKIENGEHEDSTDLLRQVVEGLHRIAQKNPPK